MVPPISPGQSPRPLVDAEFSLDETYGFIIAIAREESKRYVIFVHQKKRIRSKVVSLKEDFGL